MAEPILTPTAEAKAPHLSVVVPAYNEEKRLARSLPVILDYLSQKSYTWEIVLVDDGSGDETSRVARELCSGANLLLLRNEPNRGKGYSIRRGMLEASGTYRLFSDADLSTPIEELETFWKYVEDGYSVVIGSRALPDSQLEVRQKASRELAGRVFNAAVQTLLLPGILDSQCGFKLFTAEAAEKVFGRQELHGFAFDVEILLLARKMGYRVKEAPVRWIDSPASTVSTWRGLQGFWDLLRLRLRKL